MLPSTQRDEVLTANNVVIEGRVERAATASGSSLRQKVLFFVPDLVARNVHYELTMEIESVVKGTERAKEIALKVRLPTEEEKDFLPNSYGLIMPGTRFRVAYDHRSGNRLVNLRLVPIENTPELEATLRRASEAATEPSK